MKRIVYIICVLPLIFCNSSVNEEGKGFLFQSNLDLLIKDESLFQQINIKEDIVSFSDSGGTETIHFSLRDTSALNLLFERYAFDQALKLLEEETKDSLLSNLLLTLEPQRKGQHVGWKVALDPGHLAGDFEEAKFEDKFIEIAGSRFYEAQLTFGTARVIKERLERAGIEVLLTHDFGKPALPYTYNEWYDRLFYRSLDSMIEKGSINKKKEEKLKELYRGGSDYGKKVLFHRLYKQIDLRYRAALINKFKPDLTLIIHYNVDAENQDWLKTTERNYTMAFVPGSFMRGEMEHQEDREQMLRLLVTDQLTRSIEFSKEIIHSLKTSMNLTIAPDTTIEEYLSKYCLPTRVEGVFARNLTMTRLVESVVCYGETLYQDNIHEIIELSKNDCEIKGEKVNCRAMQVGEAYTQAIINYIENNPK